MRARAQASLSDGLPLDLTYLVVPYGRDRRVSLRVEQMPSRARLSRGRNNGDGSWSLTREELDGLFYFPPRGSKDVPTLVVRVIGLDADNGATLEVVDAIPGDTEGDSDELTPDEGEQDAELNKLKIELEKAKAALRATQSDLTEARKTIEAELEDRLVEVQAEAAAQNVAEIERARAKWQSEAKERAAKHDTRTEERLAHARESWRRETEVEIARAEEAWKANESARLAAAEAQWHEKSAQAVASEKAAHAKTQAALATTQKAAAAARSEDASARNLSAEIDRLQQALAESESRVLEARSVASGTQEKLDDSNEAIVRERKEFATKVQLIEAKLAEARASRDRNDTAETKRLRADLSAVEADLAERDHELAEARHVSADAAKRASALQSALEKATKDGTAAEAARERRHEVENRRLRADLKAAEAMLSDRERALAEIKGEASDGRKREAELRAALSKAETSSKSSDSSRLTALKTEWLAEWRLESQEKIAALEDKLRKSDLALQEARTQAKVGRRDAGAVLAEAKKEWEAAETARFAEAKAEWERHSSRVFKKAQIRLEAAEAALAEARAEATAARDRRDSAEFKRLRAEFTTASTKLAESEAQLAEAQLAVARARERTRKEVEAAVAKAEESWKANEALHHSGIETRERERGTRALAEATARLERTEAALAETRSELESERERAAVLLAETKARLERSETALTEATERIETLRDPANESELRRLRSELANLQVAHSDREAELAAVQVAARKSRERTAEQMRATMLKAEDEWRLEEAKRLEAARLDWERQAHLAAEFNAPPEAISERAAKRANRLLLDSALALVLATVVVIGITFYWRTPMAGLSNASAALPPKPVRVAGPVAPQITGAPMTVGTAFARLRAEPDAKADVTISLKRGAQVLLLERRGNWARIHVDGGDGNPAQEGWVFAASLRPIDSTTGAH